MTGGKPHGSCYLRGRRGVGLTARRTSASNRAHAGHGDGGGDVGGLGNRAQ
eukprot:CAMPEP_0197591678 /NCGR_PEP_ID=MMETSP1326-20131121/13853_1 /TAXON_ID=1155430 /ORGANISM="Genus nov. species nov., Strain RCC2288" /LENGTH=50 /DNA_ID=CAMNT_0043157219 /DNA_START=382 /DNA_END=534 /DNA_ORIENTATION=+